MITILPVPGTKASDLDTPCLVVDLDLAEKNIRTLQSFGDKKGIRVRPHVKTHKSNYWAKKQIQQGAVGVCAAKVSEAESMVYGGIENILIANEVVGTNKIRRLVSLAKQAKISVAVDNHINAKELSNAAKASEAEIQILVDVNTRLNRCGVEPSEAPDLALFVNQLPNIHFKGLMGYEGHIPPKNDGSEPEELTKALGKLEMAYKEVLNCGLKIDIVSAAGTSTYKHTGTRNFVNEIQCGTYIFMDGAYMEESPEFKPALRVISQVMSCPNDTRITSDAGLKSISVDSGMPLPIEKNVDLEKLSEEHATMSVKNNAMFELGSRISLLPMHGDTTINIHDYYFGIRNGILESIIPISARGKFT